MEFFNLWSAALASSITTCRPFPPGHSPRPSEPIIYIQLFFLGHWGLESVQFFFFFILVADILKVWGLCLPSRKRKEKEAKVLPDFALPFQVGAEGWCQTCSPVVLRRKQFGEAGLVTLRGAVTP